MTAITLTRPTVHAAPQHFSVLSRMIAGFKAWNELRLTRKALSVLSDRELADIGLHRGEIALIGR